MIFGIGIFEIIAGLSLISYVCYNSYMLWKSVEGDIEYGEEQ